MEKRIFWNDGWEFTEEFTEQIFTQIEGLTKVRIPHTVCETPFHYFDESVYQMVSGYRRTFYAKEEWKDKKILLTFEGVAHEAWVYVNGEEVGRHSCGYTAFTLDISSHLRFGGENQIVVRVDSHENLNVPPFGNVIDYMTYGGIYRDVYMEVKEPVYIEDVFVTTKNCLENVKQAEVKVTLNTVETPMTGEILLRKAGEEDWIARKQFSIACKESTQTIDVEHVTLWSLEHPALYECQVILYEGQHPVSTYSVQFGFREAQFLADGFYLNGEKVKIRGLNRHQSYPYVGYAMPKSQQIHDVDILKHELGVNAVRTSHYPQSQYFINRCDELGLLVFTELPGWQYIGDAAWKETALRNVEEMVLQYRNHPSIILWGVRINESPDDDAFYQKTNELARKLDPSRATGGVRCIKNSKLYEDVYTYNDFSYEGKKGQSGIEPRNRVSKESKASYLVSEYNGHMFPTKSFDCEEHRMEHALRHAKVVNDIAKAPDIAGGFGWCMTDYNTHKDFGSGDRICYHGVMDMFRNPKTATYVYQSQQEKEPVLVVGSSMDIGEHPGCYMRDIYAFTNADSIRFYKNDVFIKEYTSKDSAYKDMAHGPIGITDVIGDQLIAKEGYSRRKSELVKKVLSDSMIYGMNNLPFKTKLIAARLILFYGMKFDDAVTLYNTYVGIWGGKSISYRFEAVKDGKVVKSVYKGVVRKIQLEVDVDHTELVEENSYDVAAIRIRAVDEHHNVLSYYQEPVTFTVEGNLALIGPDVISLKGGMGGTYVKTIGQSGEGSLTIKADQMEPVTVAFTIAK